MGCHQEVCSLTLHHVITPHTSNQRQVPNLWKRIMSGLPIPFHPQAVFQGMHSYILISLCMTCMFLSVYVCCVCSYQSMFVVHVLISLCLLCMFLSVYVRCVCSYQSMFVVYVLISLCLLCMFLSVYECCVCSYQSMYVVYVLISLCMLCMFLSVYVCHLCSLILYEQNSQLFKIVHDLSGFCIFAYKQREKTKQDCETCVWTNLFW